MQTWFLTSQIKVDVHLGTEYQPMCGTTKAKHAKLCCTLRDKLKQKGNRVSVQLSFYNAIDKMNMLVLQTTCIQNVSCYVEPNGIPSCVSNSTTPASIKVKEPRHGWCILKN